MSYSSEDRRQQRWKRAATRELIDGRLVAVNANEHGTCSTYGNWHCRCEPCTYAHTAEQAQMRAKRRTERVLVDGILVATKAARHNAATYTNWGCRCRICTDAFTADCTYLKQRRQERA